MAYQHQSSVYVPAVQQLFYLADVMRIWTNQSDKDCFTSRWLMFFKSVSCVPKMWIFICRYSIKITIYEWEKVCRLVFTAG